MEGERKSSIQKFKSNDAEWNADAREHFEKKFKARRWYANLERKKTPEELKMIRAIVPMLNEFLSRYGASPIAVSARNIHILDKSKMTPEAQAEFEKNKYVSGGFDAEEQHIGIMDWKVRSSLNFANILVHELVHFHSFGSIIKHADDSGSPYQVGLAINKTIVGDDETVKINKYFNDINEAVTEELAKRFLPRLAAIPILKKSVDEIIKINKRVPDADVSDLLVDTQEIQTAQGVEFETSITTHQHAYPESRERLRQLISEIYERHPGRFSSKDEIFDIFARAAMTGDIKEMASFVEGLGRGRLRELARIQAD